MKTCWIATQSMVEVLGECLGKCPNFPFFLRACYLTFHRLFYLKNNFLVTIRHFTREALPRLDNYRNILSVQAAYRPTLDELHNATLTNKVTFPFHVTQFFFFCFWFIVTLVQEYCPRKTHLLRDICPRRSRFHVSLQHLHASWPKQCRF